MILEADSTACNSLVSIYLVSFIQPYTSVYTEDEIKICPRPFPLSWNTQAPYPAIV
jgi:hypothetical protein